MYIRAFIIFLIAILVLSPTKTFACSFYRVEAFKPPIPSRFGTGEKPASPKVAYELIRGKLGDGNSCDDTGVVKVLIDANAESLEDVGFSIEVIENSTGQQIFPDYAFFTKKFDEGRIELYFPWVDGATDVQEPVRIVFKLIALSPTWAESDPVLITIEDEGRFWH